MGERVLQAYIQRRGKKPTIVEGVTFTGKLPASLMHEGQTFYFVAADLSRRTITFTDVKASTH